MAETTTSTTATRPTTTSTTPITTASWLPSASPWQRSPRYARYEPPKIFPAKKAGTDYTFR